MTTGMRVLIVEDDPAESVPMSVLLGLKGYEIITAKDGETAFDLLQKDSFNLVITDMQMPDKDDGLKLCQSIRRNIGELLPVILCTGVERKEEERENEGWECFNAILRKPIKFDNLVGEVARLLQC